MAQGAAAHHRQRLHPAHRCGRVHFGILFMLDRGWVLLMLDRGQASWNQHVDGSRSCSAPRAAPTSSSQVRSVYDHRYRLWQAATLFCVDAACGRVACVVACGSCSAPQAAHTSHSQVRHTDNLAQVCFESAFTEEWQHWGSCCSAAGLAPPYMCAQRTNHDKAVVFSRV
jgi:hypothetical protein